MKHDRSILSYYLFRFFEDFALVYPVYLIYFEQVGLDYLELSLLLLIWGVPVILMEVPSGIVADLWSRRMSLVVGLFLKAAGFGVWLVRPDFAGFAIGFVLWGLQEAICTGTVDALLYDLLAARGEEDRFVAVSGRGAFASRAGVVLSVLLGGWVYTQSIVFVLGASVVSMLLAAGLATRIREHQPPESSGTPSSRKAVAAALRVRLREIADSVRDALEVRAFVPLIVFGSLATVTYGVLDEYDFLFATRVGVPVAFVGVWGATRFVCEGVGGAFADRIQRLLGLGSIRRLALWMGSAGLLLIPAAALGRVAILPLYFVYFFMMASAEVIFQGWVQERIASTGRATVSSLVSMVYEVLGALLLVGAGLVSSSFGLEAIFVSGGVVAVVAAVVFAGVGRSAQP